MVTDRILALLGASYENRILIYDYQLVFQKIDYLSSLKSRGFQIYFYKNSELLRLQYDQKIRYTQDKWVIVAFGKGYIPYDILENMYVTEISYQQLYPNLNSEVIHKHIQDIELIDSAYEEVYSDKSLLKETNEYIVNNVFSKENLINYCNGIINQIKMDLHKEKTIDLWFTIADKKALLEYYSAMSKTQIDTAFIEDSFKEYLLGEYQYFSGINKKEYPIMLSKVLEFIAKDNNKIALLVMDGMSLFDFEVLCREWKAIEYEKFHSVALIPTTTSISRQCLLSGKLPVELINPFTLAHEEKGFKEAAITLGYQDFQIQYARGYDFDLNLRTKFLAIINNDIDDLVHSQLQGRIGMLQSLKYLAKQGKLEQLIKRLYKEGFQIYLTADHGNTLCKGIGKLTGTGVEVETKSKRMVVIKDFAQIENIKSSRNMLEFPSTYLNKAYKYLICNTGVSLDNKGEIVMTHGGISIDEVVVPWIKIKEVL